MYVCHDRAIIRQRLHQFPATMRKPARRLLSAHQSSGRPAALGQHAGAAAEHTHSGVQRSSGCCASGGSDRPSSTDDGRSKAAGGAAAGRALSIVHCHAGASRWSASLPGLLESGKRRSPAGSLVSVKLLEAMLETTAKPCSNSRVQTSSAPALKTRTGSANAWPSAASYSV
jgi:hypothetical protein